MNMQRDIAPGSTTCGCSHDEISRLGTASKPADTFTTTAETATLDTLKGDNKRGVRWSIMMNHAEHHPSPKVAASPSNADKIILDVPSSKSLAGRLSCEDGSFFDLCKRIFVRVVNFVSCSVPVLVFREGLDRAKEYASCLKDQFSEWFAEAFDAIKATRRLRSTPLPLPSIAGDVSIPRVVVSSQAEPSKGEGAKRIRRGAKRRHREEELGYFFQEEQEGEAGLKTASEQPSYYEKSAEKELIDARRRIREIDAQYGTTQNNPRVQEILASLGTHYDSLGLAIEAVYKLQIEEILEGLRGQDDRTRS